MKEVHKARRGKGIKAYNASTDPIKMRRQAAKITYKASYADADITLDEFMEMSQQNCHYCNAPPANKMHLGKKKDGSDRNLQKRKSTMGDTYYTKVWASEFGDEAAFIYNGLDRIDQTKLHSKDNVVVCCKSCNFMKSVASKEQFLEKIKRIYLWTTKQH